MKICTKVSSTFAQWWKYNISCEKRKRSSMRFFTSLNEMSNRLGDVRATNVEFLE